MTTRPDAYCFTLPNGECISTDPRCIHQPLPGRVEALTKALISSAKKEADRIFEERKRVESPESYCPACDSALIFQRCKAICSNPKCSYRVTCSEF